MTVYHSKFSKKMSYSFQQKYRELYFTYLPIAMVLKHGYKLYNRQFDSTTTSFKIPLIPEKNLHTLLNNWTNFIDRY